MPPSDERITQAMWEGDTDFLQEHLRCVCCCAEHTFENCPARRWEGCRGQGTLTYSDLRSWAKHYGMTLEEFLVPNP